jgi:hypothetical protein
MIASFGLLELEKEYPGWVHVGFQFSKFAVYPWDSERGDTKGEIDLVVSDLTGFEPDDTSHPRFGSRPHELFLEAKHLPKGHWLRDIEKKIEIGIPKDFAAQRARLSGVLSQRVSSSMRRTTSSGLLSKED